LRQELEQEALEGSPLAVLVDSEDEGSMMPPDSEHCSLEDDSDVDQREADLMGALSPAALVLEEKSDSKAEERQDQWRQGPLVI